MLTTAAQRIALVVGVLWILFAVSATLAEIFDGRRRGHRLCTDRYPVAFHGRAAPRTQLVSRFLNG